MACVARGVWAATMAADVQAVAMVLQMKTPHHQSHHPQQESHPNQDDQVLQRSSLSWVKGFGEILILHD